jgi:hypothetical protein
MVYKEREQQAKEDPESRPSERFPHGHNVGFSVKNAQIEGQKEED